MSSSILLQLLPVPGQNVEPGDDIKEAAPHVLGSGKIGVQLVLAPQLPSPRKVICLQDYAKSKDTPDSLCGTYGLLNSAQKVVCMYKGQPKSPVCGMLTVGVRHACQCSPC